MGGVASAGRAAAARLRPKRKAAAPGAGTSGMAAGSGTPKASTEVLEPVKSEGGGVSRSVGLGGESCLPLACGFCSWQ